MKPTLASNTGRMQPISRAATELAAASISANTRRAYARWLRDYAAWSTGRAEETADARLAEYLTHLHEHGLAPASVSLARAGIRFGFRIADKPDPSGPNTNLVIAGIRRQRRKSRGQVKGLTWSAADTCAAVSAVPGTPAGLRNAAIVAIMSDAMLRASELCALQEADVETMQDGTGRLHVRSSKTDQEGEGAMLFLGAPTVARIQAWLRVAGIVAGPLFRGVYRSGRVRNTPLTPVSVRRIVKGIGERAGIEGSGSISGHSFRVGSAQSLIERGATLAECQLSGRWKSARMPAYYARAQIAGRAATARLRYGA